MTAFQLTRDFVRKLEAAEAEFNMAKLQALRDQDGCARCVEFGRFGETLTTCLADLPHNPSYNRAFSFTNEDAELVPSIVEWFRTRKVCFWFDVVPALVGRDALQQLVSRQWARLTRRVN